jgi:DNA primase
MRGILSSEAKDEIRRRTDVVALVSAHATLKKAGRYYKGLCPFHQEKTPSFHVDPDRGLFHCFGCGKGGDIFDFVMLTANLTFTEAARDLARRAGVALDTSPEAARRASEREQVLRALDAALGYYSAALAAGTPAASKARAYLERRGLSPQIVQAFQLGYAPPAWDGLLSALRARGYTPDVLERAGLVVARSGGEGHFDVFRDRLMFPILDLQDHVIAFGGRALDDAQPTYLNSRETVAFAKGRTLYGLNRARDAIRELGESLVVEGYMDALACHQFGFPQAVASLGTALTPDQVALLRRFAPRVVLVYDSDQAGEAATERGLTLFEEAEVSGRVAVLPAGDDPDTFLRTRGPDAFRRLVAEAAPMFDYRMERAVRRHDPGSREGRLGMSDEVLTVIQSVTNPVRRAEYLRALAERLALPEDALRQRLRARERRGRPGGRDAGAVTPTSDRAREEAERLLLHMMVVEPPRRAAIAKTLAANSFVNPAHQRLAAVLLGAPTAEVGALREQLDDEAAALLMRLAFEPPPVMDRDKERAVADALRFLSQTQPAAAEARRVWEALQSAQASGDDAEVRRLQAAYAELIVASKRTG